MAIAVNESPFGIGFGRLVQKSRLTMQQTTISSTDPTTAPMAWAPKVRNQNRPNTIGVLLLVLLYVCIFSDINRYSIILFGTRNLLSPVYLILCFLVFIAFRFRFLTSIGRAGAIYFAFCILYLGISSAVRLADFSDLTIYIVSYRLRTMVTSLVFLLASALGIYHLLNSLGNRKTLWIMVLCTLSLLVGVVISKAMKSALTSRYSKDFNVQEIQMEAHEQIAQGRGTGIFGDPNQAGMFFTTGALISFVCLSVARTSFERFFLLSVISAFGLCVLLTFSRSAILTYLIMAISQMTLSRVVRGRAAFLAGLIGIGGVIWFVSVGYQQFTLTLHQQKRISDFGRLAQGNFDATTTGHRFAVAAEGLAAWAEKPMFGHGIGMGVEVWRPHNEFVRILIDCGVVGCLPFIFFFVATTIMGFRCRVEPYRNLVLGYMAIFLCSCMTLQTNMNDNIPAIMLGMCFAALATAREQGRQQRAIPRQQNRLTPMPNYM